MATVEEELLDIVYKAYSQGANDVFDGLLGRDEAGFPAVQHWLEMERRAFNQAKQNVVADIAARIKQDNQHRR